MYINLSVLDEQRAAAMVEFALVAVFLIGLTSAAIEFGLTIHRRSMFNYLTSKVVREVAASGITNCTQIQNEAAKAFNGILGDRSARLSSSKVVFNSQAGNQILVVSGEMDIRCLFCFLQDAETVTIRSESMLETSCI